MNCKDCKNFEPKELMIPVGTLVLVTSYTSIQVVLSCVTEHDEESKYRLKDSLYWYSRDEITPVDVYPINCEFMGIQYARKYHFDRLTADDLKAGLFKRPNRQEGAK